MKKISAQEAISDLIWGVNILVGAEVKANCSYTLRTMYKTDEFHNLIIHRNEKS